ncbi:MAG: RNA 2',3'-cyclic phosphodiesterase [Actinobacteria bacterium]|nr:RNA 2',3'-cyclic phosphodiesterase [Actinomycetota bacterium]
MTPAPSPRDGATQVRLFVALELPSAVVDALLAWRTPLLARCGGLRSLAPEALHVTLAFLGWKPAEAIAPLTELVEACASAAGGSLAGLALGEPLWLPRRRPRVLAVALDDRHGALGALQAGLVARLAEDGWHEPEARPYLPHVTVARSRERNGLRVPRDAVLPALATLTFDGSAVVLYRSRLERAGARYEPLFVRRLA